MGHYTYVALTGAVPGREADFERWYDEQHLADVARVPGVVGARRFSIAHQEVNVAAAPVYTAMAIYELDTDDPQLVIAEIKARAGTAAMPLTDAYARAGNIQIVGVQAKSV